MIYLTIFIFYLLGSFLQSRTYSQIQVKVKITGLHPVPSMIYMAAFDNPRSFNEQSNGAVVRMKIPHDKTTTATIPVFNLKPGVYAFLVFQDENGNKILDTNLLGIPTEAYGYSGKSGLIPGPPNFEKSKLIISQGNTTEPFEVFIHLR